MSPLDALRTVTAVAAGVCGLADLVAVAGDPIADPAALLEALAVYKSGSVVA